MTVVIRHCLRCGEGVGFHTRCPGCGGRTKTGPPPQKKEEPVKIKKEPPVKIKIGRRVKSYDHPTKQSWVEGVVTGFREVGGCFRYVIHVDRDVDQGKDYEHRVGTEVFPPIKGTPTWFGEVTAGVELVPQDDIPTTELLISSI